MRVREIHEMPRPLTAPVSGLVGASAGPWLLVSNMSKLLSAGEGMLQSRLSVCVKGAGLCVAIAMWTACLQRLQRLQAATHATPEGCL